MYKELNKVFSMIKTKLKSEKVELARKPESILNDIKKLDQKMSVEEGKMDKIYLTYKNSQKDFAKFSDDINSQLDKYESDLNDIQDAAQELGLDGRDIPGFKDAADLLLKVSKIANFNKKSYPSVKIKVRLNH